jgi:1-phosphofructokinase/tagatose 6-phosphate kinase
MKSVLTVCLSPTFQRIITFKEFNENEVNRSSVYTQVASGKGINESRTFNMLGRRAVNITHLGGPRVEEFLELCKADNIELRYVPVEAETRTCITIVNEARHTSTELVEECIQVNEEASEKLFSLFMEELPKHDAVVISGTKAMGFSKNLYPKIVTESRKAGKLTVLDIKGDDLKACLEARPSIIKPNLSEFTATFMPDKAVMENEDSEYLKGAVELITKDIYNRYGIKSVITRGKFDTWVYDGEGLVPVHNKLEVQVMITIGCGDTLTAALTHALMDGKELTEAVSFGMECATKKAANLKTVI